MIAAEKLEFEGIRRRVSSLRPLELPVDYAAEGELEEHCLTLVANGAGPRLAAQAVDAACGSRKVDAVISTGFCGGLDPSLSVGQVIAASEIDARESGKRYPAYLPQETSPASACGPILSMDRVAVSVEEKEALRATGATAVEMEAAGVAEQASRHRIPFYCIRVVSDAAGESMPLDFNLYRTAEGRFQRGAIACAALARPFRCIPGLLRLQRQARIASMKLGEFFADCRF
jgi:adenosylhomocysteine nucleosidase